MPPMPSRRSHRCSEWRAYCHRHSFKPVLRGRVLHSIRCKASRYVDPLHRPDGESLVGLYGWSVSTSRFAPKLRRLHHDGFRLSHRDTALMAGIAPDSPVSLLRDGYQNHDWRLPRLRGRNRHRVSGLWVLNRGRNRILSKLWVQRLRDLSSRIAILRQFVPSAKFLDHLIWSTLVSTTCV